MLNAAGIEAAVKDVNEARRALNAAIAEAVKMKIKIEVEVIGPPTNMAVDVKMSLPLS